MYDTIDDIYIYAKGWFAENTRDYTEWLSSPDGIAAVKAMMIERGWEWHSRYYGNTTDDPYSFSFCRYDGRELIIELTSENDTEPEAVLAATEKALRAEEK